MEFLAEEILKLTGKYKITLSEGAFEHLITQIYVALKRMKHGCYVEELEAGEIKKHAAEEKLARSAGNIGAVWKRQIHF